MYVFCCCSIESKKLYFLFHVKNFGRVRFPIVDPLEEKAPMEKCFAAVILAGTNLKKIFSAFHY